MGKKIFIIFIKGFVKAILILMCMILAGVGSFFGTRKYYSVKNERAREKEAQSMISGAKLDEVSRNLIFVHNEDKNSISSMMLEVFDTTNGTMSYVMLPTSVEVTLPAGLYRKLLAINQEIPQIFKFSKLTKYFKDGDTKAYGFGALIVENTLNIDISYYTVVDKETFETAFESVSCKANEDGTLVGDSYSPSAQVAEPADTGDGSDPFAHDDSYVTTNNDYESSDDVSTSIQASKISKSVKVYKLKSDFTSHFDSIKDDEVDFTDYMTSKILPMFQSNLEGKDKLSYCSDYMKLDSSSIYYYVIPGMYYEKAYVIDNVGAKKLFKKLGVPKSDEGNYEEEETTEESIPKITNVQVLNGSGVQGMAAKWQAYLGNNGFTVPAVGNYDSRLNDSLIIVPEDGMGQELVGFFKNATIQVGTVPQGYEAVVVVGINDATL